MDGRIGVQGEDYDNPVYYYSQNLSSCQVFNFWIRNRDYQVSTILNMKTKVVLVFNWLHVLNQQLSLTVTKKQAVVHNFF